MNTGNRVLQTSLLTVTTMATLACAKGDPSFSVLGDQASFSQSGSFEQVSQKIDILWVVDNSGSMATSQSRLTANFNSFITKFQTLKYDFRMAVTTTDAIFGVYDNLPAKTLLLDGVPGARNNTGVRVMNNLTPNLSNVFMINATQGINGNGDERAFQSFKTVLDNPLNSAFRRSDAFLAIIIVSDEDDFSASTSAFLNNNYADARLHTVTSYKTYLDTLVGVGKHSVNTISVQDEPCRQQLMTDGFTGRSISLRYNQLATMTGGVKASLCSDFGSSLQLISDTIISKNPTTSFKLSREPIVNSIGVFVNGVSVRPDAVNGWTYDAATWTVTFHGTSIPAVGASISINFDPLAPSN